MFSLSFKRRPAWLVGCALSENSVRLAQLDHTARPASLRLRTAMEPLPRLDPAQPGPWLDGLRQAMGHLLETQKLSRRELVLCLPAGMMGYRRLRLAGVPAAELPSAVHWRVARELSVSVKEIQSGHYDVGQLEEAGKPCRDVIAVTASTAGIEPIVTMFDELGLTIRAADAAAGALTRVLSLQWPDDASRMIVEVGVTSSAVMVARAGQPCFIRTIPGGRRQIIERAAARLGIDAPAQARLWDILDHETVTPAPDATTLHTLCEVAMLHAAELAHEVKLCLHYMLSLDGGGLLPRRGCIVGAGPQEDIFLRRITEACDIDLEPLESALPASLRHALQEHAAESSLDPWLTAIGLAMYDHAPQSLEVAV